MLMANATYTFPAIRTTLTEVFTNKTPTDAYRGALQVVTRAELIQSAAGAALVAPGEAAPRTAPNVRSRVSNRMVPPFLIYSFTRDSALGDRDFSRGSIGQ